MLSVPYNPLRVKYIRVLYVLRVAIVLRSIEVHPMVKRFGRWKFSSETIVYFLRTRLLFRNIEVGHLDAHEGTTQIHSGTAYVECPLQPTEGPIFRLQSDPAPGSGALNSFANQYPRIKRVVSRYGGGEMNFSLTVVSA